MNVEFVVDGKEGLLTKQVLHILPRVYELVVIEGDPRVWHVNLVFWVFDKDGQRASRVRIHLKPGVPVGGA